MRTSIPSICRCAVNLMLDGSFCERRVESSGMHRRSLIYRQYLRDRVFWLKSVNLLIEFCLNFKYKNSRKYVILSFTAKKISVCKIKNRLKLHNESFLLERIKILKNKRHIIEYYIIYFAKIKKIFKTFLRKL